MAIESTAIDVGLRHQAGLAQKHTIPPCVWIVITPGLEPYLDLRGCFAAMVAVLHKPGGGAKFPESAIGLVTVPGPDIEAVGVGKVTVALFR